MDWTFFFSSPLIFSVTVLPLLVAIALVFGALVQADARRGVEARPSPSRYLRHLGRAVLAVLVLGLGHFAVARLLGDPSDRWREKARQDAENADRAVRSLEEAERRTRKMEELRRAVELLPRAIETSGKPWSAAPIGSEAPASAPSRSTPR